jgi:hypothetical protein
LRNLKNQNNVNVLRQTSAPPLSIDNIAFCYTISLLPMSIPTGEARMTWSEVSEDLAAWTMPGERTVAHVVRLSAPARDVLNERLPDECDEAKRVLVELRAAGTLALPGAVGTPFGDWSQAKRALDAAISDARVKAAAAPARRRRRLSRGHCTICAEPSPPACNALVCALK